MNTIWTVDDVRLLLDHLELRTVAAVEAIVARYFPDEQLSGRSRMLLEDLLAEDRVDRKQR